MRPPAAANRRTAKDATPTNLKILLRERYRFLGDHVRAGDRVLEVGAGIGITADYLPETRLWRTDIERNDWIDAVADGQALPFVDASFDAVICIAALHHMPHPLAALREMGRVLRPGGKSLIMEVHVSWLLRLALALTRHEYIDRSIDPFGSRSCLTRPGDNWSGNNAIGDRLLLDRARLADTVPEFTVIHHRFTESVLFVNSGGVNYKAPYLPLPESLLEWVAALDRALCRLAPDAFAICQEVVLERVGR